MAGMAYQMFDPYAKDRVFLKAVGSYKEWSANIVALRDQLLKRPNPTRICFILRKNPLDARYADMTQVERGSTAPKAATEGLLDAALNGMYKIADEAEQAAAERAQKEHQLRKLKRQGDLAAAREAQLDLGRDMLSREIEKREAELFSDPAANAPASAAADPK